MQQNLLPHELLVVIGPGDNLSEEIANTFINKIERYRVIPANEPSLVNALNIGMANANGEIISLIDDDVELPPDWLEKIINAFISNPLIGAYGGRDRIRLQGYPHLENPKPAEIVGRFRFDGLLIGNHHCGARFSPVEVDVLKGVNLSFRRTAFPVMSIDNNLSFKGAEICTEVDLCQTIIKNGFKVVYDNDNYLFHYASARDSFDDRTDLFAPAVSRRHFNFGYVMGKHRPIFQSVLNLGRSFFLGSRYSPGILWAVILSPRYGLKCLLIPFIMLTNYSKGLFKGIQARLSAFDKRAHFI